MPSNTRESSSTTKELVQLQKILNEYKISTKSNAESKEYEDESFHNMLIDSIDNAVNKLETFEIKYNSLYDNSPILMHSMNKDGIILDCNTTYAKRLGYSVDEIVGKNILEHVAEQSHKKLNKFLELWKNTGKINNVEIWLKTKYGSIFPVLLSATMIYNSKGEFIGSNTALQDISDNYLIKLEEEKKHRLEIKIEELKKSDKLREELLSIVKHEFKTPLTPLKGYCEILKDEFPNMQLSSEQKEIILGIEKSVKKFEDVIDNVLKLNEIELNYAQFKNDIILINDFMTSIHQDHKKRSVDKNIKFDLQLIGKSLIRSDSEKLQDVFDQLIKNAVSFTPKTNGMIEIGTVDRFDSVEFYVKNNGPSIPESELKNIFKKFYQVDTSHTRKHGGMGLGLAICKNIIEKLGGHISCSNTEGFVTFSFTLPKLVKELQVGPNEI